ncbi:YveK family protein [Paenibacillus thailandensis]|uniref:YveK family protein n=1 Tax=Paenibacillus thailandensis TaxID=393250 RepID=A0ABW5QY95_9BACL
MELKHYWLVVKKRLWILALIVIVSCAAVGYYTVAYITPQYEATTSLIVNDYKDSSSPVETMDLGSINSTVMLIKTYKEVIRTPRIMKEVAEAYPQLNTTYGELLGKVSVSSVSETQVMSITVRDDSYERAARMANAVAAVFQKTVPTLMKVDNVAILNQADPEEARGPVSPNLVVNVAVAFILSFMAGLALCFLLEFLDDTVKTEQDVAEVLELPVLSSIAKIKQKDMDGGGPSAKPMTGREKNVSLGS